MEGNSINIKVEEGMEGEQHGLNRLLEVTVEVKSEEEELQSLMEEYNTVIKEEIDVEVPMISNDAEGENIIKEEIGDINIDLEEHGIDETMLRELEENGKVIKPEDVCIHCEYSLRHGHLLNRQTERVQAVRAIISEWISPRQILFSTRICQSCWVKAEKEIKKRKSLQGSAGTVSSVNEIYLPKYTRAENTDAKCIFMECQEIELMAVPSSLRVLLFSDIAFYVPSNCKICEKHLNSNQWQSLIERNKEIHNFSGEQIEDVMLLLKNATDYIVDVENIDKSEDYLVNYWLGISKSEFKILLDQNPALKSKSTGATALAAYLVKLKTGCTDIQLASKFNIPKSTMKRLIKMAKDNTKQLKE